MKIVKIDTGILEVPLKKPFITALRTVEKMENIIVRIQTDNGLTGYGEAPPTAAITGDTRGAITGAIHEVLKPLLMGKDLSDFSGVLDLVQKGIVRNTSAKAALECALYDLRAQQLKLPLYRLLNGADRELETDVTISVNEPQEMAEDSLRAVGEGFRILKIKVGKDIVKDLDRLKEIRKAVGNEIPLRLDANQGWERKEAVTAIKLLEREGFNLDFVEQPLKAWDLKGMKEIRNQVSTTIVADESLFSPGDALRIIEEEAADMMNIKLMKCGGISQAVKIATLAEVKGMKCMVGCMLESKLAVTAAAHVALSSPVITKIDLDSPLLGSEDPIRGGISYNKNKITLPTGYGLGIEAIDGVKWHEGDHS